MFFMAKQSYSNRKYLRLLFLWRNMLKIQVNQKEDWCTVTCDGHAKYAPKGTDIVCSAVSSLYNTLYYVVLVDSTAKIESLSIGNNRQVLSITELDDIAEKAINYFVKGCELISNDYAEYVQI
jgi:uncharacterized protein YsxB (DUF464 family)